MSAILAFVAILCLAMAVPRLAGAAEDQPDARPPKVPHNAFAKTGRADLEDSLRKKGEIRVVIGLETPQEIARRIDRTPDHIKEQAVADRQARVLQRLAGHDLRQIKRLRLHHFMVATVDAKGLAALLADPEVTSVTEDRPNVPLL